MEVDQQLINISHTPSTPSKSESWSTVDQLSLRKFNMLINSCSTCWISTSKQHVTQLLVNLLPLIQLVQQLLINMLLQIQQVDQLLTNLLPRPTDRPTVRDRPTDRPYRPTVRARACLGWTLLDFLGLPYRPYRPTVRARSCLVWTLLDFLELPYRPYRPTAVEVQASDTFF